MKKILMSVFLLTVLLLSVAMVSAVVNYVDSDGNELSELVLTGEHGSQATISFKLDNDYDKDATNIVLTKPDLKVGSKTISSSNLVLSGVPSKVEDESQSNLITLTINIPQNQEAGVYEGTLEGEGKYTSSISFDIPIKTSSISFDIPIKLTVTSDPKLEVISQPTILSQSQNSKFTIKNTGNTVLTPAISVNSINHKGKLLEFDYIKTLTIQPNTEKEITITPKTAIPADFPLAGQFTEIKITEASLPSEVAALISPLKLDVEKSYCVDGCQGEDKLDVDVDISNIAGFGTEDDEWYPLDEVEVEVKVKNDIDDTIKDIIVEWCLYNPDTDECILDDEESDFNLKENKDKTLLINFQLDPNDMDEEDDEYILYVKVYSDHEDYGEEKLCVDYSQKISIIIRDEDFVVLDKIQAPEEVPCGTEVEIITKAWNIGSANQEGVYVILKNEDLGIINKRFDIGDIDVLEDENVRFTFTVPKDAEEKTHLLEFLVVDEDGDIFINDNDDEARFTYQLKVKGNCQLEQNVKITAELSSETPEAVAGQRVIIIATIKNTGDAQTTYDLSISGHTAWSSGAVDPASIILDAGESQEVKVYLDINGGVTGEKDFKIVASYGEESAEQAMSLVIGEGLSKGKILESIRQNWFIYAIVIINLVLVIAIIVAIRRIVAAPRV